MKARCKIACLKLFYCYLQEFSIHRKSKQGLLGRWTDSLQNLAAVYLAKGRPGDFDLTLQYAQALTDKLANIEKISHRVNKEQQGELKVHLSLYFSSTLHYCFVFCVVVFLFLTMGGDWLVSIFN